MKMKRMLTGVLAGVMLFGSIQLLAPIKRVVAVQQHIQKLSTKKSIKFKNKPMGYTCQKFYIDDDENYLYATYKPVGGTDDHLLCRYNLNESRTIATCESFMILENSGHGMILDGETRSKQTYLYVGCDAQKGEATGVACINYDVLPKYEYNESDKCWEYKDANLSKGVPSLKSGEFYNKKQLVKNKNVKKNSISEYKYKAIKSEKNFAKGDFCVASTGAHMVYEKYYNNKNNKKSKLNIKKIGENFNLTGLDLKNLVGTNWQATDAWTKYDTFFTTQSDVKKLKANNTGLKIVRRSGEKYQHKEIYSLNLPEQLLGKIKDKPTFYTDNKGEGHWRVEIEGVQVMPFSSNKATTYVYVCSKEKKFHFERIFHFNVTKK